MVPRPRPLLPLLVEVVVVLIIEVVVVVEIVLIELVVDIVVVVEIVITTPGGQRELGRPEHREHWKNLLTWEENDAANRWLASGSVAPMCVLAVRSRAGSRRRVARSGRCALALPPSVARLALTLRGAE